MVRRLLLLLLLLLVLAMQACECGSQPVLECEDAACDGGAAGAGGSGGGATIGTAGGSVECASCLVEKVGWKRLGGFTSVEDSHTLSPCGRYVLARTNLGSGYVTYCDANLACSPARIDVLLTDPVITTALQAHTLFGENPIKWDGALFRVMALGEYFDIGFCSPDCLPPQVKELQELLEGITAQELCMP